MSLIAHSASPISNSSAPLRRVWHFIPLALITLTATWLVLTPHIDASPLALAFGLLVVFLFPGYLGAITLFASPQPLSLTRLPIFFVFSLALWAIPATALQILGATWFAFHIVLIVILWALLIAAFLRAWHDTNTTEPFLRRDLIPELVIALVCIVVAILVANGERDADDWLYLQVTQQFIGSNPFQIFATSEARYSIRYAFHIWIFLQAFLGEWLNADVVSLLRQTLPVLLAPLGIVAAYAWGKTFFGTARAALLALGIQLLIYVTFATTDGWGNGFFARSAQDKFLVWLIVLPLALVFAWNFLRAGNFSNWLAYGATMIAGLWVHPVSLFLVVLSLGGFALFNLLSRSPFSRRRWLFLTVASLPALLSPLVIRATTLPAVFTVNTPDVAAYLRLSNGRLLFQPPFYIIDPALIAHPLILVSIALLVLFAARLREDTRIQFLYGATLVPLALLINPFTARILGEMLTPWQLWRMTWGLPVAFILSQILLERRTLPIAHWSPAKISSALILLLAAALVLSNLNFGRTLLTLRNTQMLDSATQGVMQSLRTNLHTPASVLLPRNLTRYAPAYTSNARVMSNEAQKPEDTRGIQIDRFYSPQADTKFLEAFLDFWQIEYVVAPKGSLQERFVKTRAGSVLVYENKEYGLYQLRLDPK